MEVAILDEDGVLIEVRAVSAVDYKTDPTTRSVALHEGHDMRGRLRDYRWDYLRGCFLPLSSDPQDVAERNAPGLVDALVAVTEELIEKGIILSTPKHRKALRDWRETAR